jgi:hypothetical protein
VPADDDIDSFWEGIRPPREPQPEPPRKVHQHAARFRESFVGTDEQWDRRARDIQAGGLLTDPRSFTMTEIQGDLDERARLLREWRPAEEQHQIGFSEGTLRAQQGVAQVLREELARAARIPDAMSEEEQGFSVDDRPDVSMGANVYPDTPEAHGLRRILTDNPSEELQRRREEYARLAQAAGLPEGSITVDRADPDLIDRIDRFQLATIPEGMIESVRQNLQRDLGHNPDQDELRRALMESEERRYVAHLLEQHPGPFVRPSAPAVPSPLRYEGSQEETILTRLTNDLGALGFHPESISLERSIDGGTSLTFHMSPSYELETDSGPDEVSVTFSHRL